MNSATKSCNDSANIEARQDLRTPGEARHLGRVIAQLSTSSRWGFGRVCASRVQTAHSKQKTTAMKYIFFLLGTVATLGFFGGCEKEDLIPDIVKQLEFECPGGDSESYFEGVIDGNEFCYRDGVNDYEIEISQTAGFRTDGPTTSTDIDTSEVSNYRVWDNLGFLPAVVWDEPPHSNQGIIPHLKHYVLLETPASKTDISLAEIIKNNLTQVGDLPLQSAKTGSLEGFNVVFRFNDNVANISRIFEARGGNQDGSYLKITELKITDFPNGTHCEVTFEFSCNLFYYGDPKKFFARLEDGKMRLVFDL